MYADQFQAVLQRSLSQVFEEKFETLSEKLDQVFDDKLKIRVGASVDLPKVERQVKSLVGKAKRTNLVKERKDESKSDMLEGSNGLEEPGPEGWMKNIDPETKTSYYHNTIAGDVSWDQPCDTNAEDVQTTEEAVIVEPEPEDDDGKNALPAGWMEHIDPTYFDG